MTDKKYCKLKNHVTKLNQRKKTQYYSIINILLYLYLFIIFIIIIFIINITQLQLTKMTKDLGGVK